MNRQDNDGPMRDFPVREDPDPRKDPIFIALSLDRPANRELHNANRVLSGNSHYPAAASYEEDLKDLVRRCLNFDQKDRPTLREILDAANEALENEDAKDALEDKMGLGLSLPDSDQFMFGESFSLEKHRPFTFKRSDSDDSLYG